MKDFIEYLKALNVGHATERDRAQELFYRNDAISKAALEILAKFDECVAAEEVQTASKAE